MLNDKRKKESTLEVEDVLASLYQKYAMHRNQLLQLTDQIFVENIEDKLNRIEDYDDYLLEHRLEEIRKWTMCKLDILSIEENLKVIPNYLGNTGRKSWWI